MTSILTPRDYEFYGPEPYDWQRECFLESVAREYFAEFSEPRCGKSKPLLDTAVYRYLLGPASPLYVDLCMVVALPMGAPLNWERIEVPKHVGDRIPTYCLTWDAGQASKRVVRGREVWGSEAWRDKLLTFEHFKGLRFLFVNGEAVLTESLLRFLRTVFPKSRVMCDVDESTLVIKAPPGPNGKRTDKMIVIGHQKTVVARRILDGTPVGEGPLDLFGQTEFLKRGLLGFKTFASFRANHAEQAEQSNWKYKWAKDKGVARAAELGLTGQAAEDFASAVAVNMGGKVWEGLTKDEENGTVKWKNLDQIEAKLKTFSVRIRRKDVYSSPEPVFQKIFFEMTSDQRRVYEEMRETYEAELQDGSQVTAKNVLERYMRLQQISRNFYPSEKTITACPTCIGDDAACPTCEGAGYLEAKLKQPPRRIGLINPCLEAMMEDIKRECLPTLVWCRFHQDLEDLMAALRDAGMSPVEYSGRIKRAEEKDAAKVAFQTGKAGAVVATPRSAGRAIALPCRRMYYYDHEYSLLSRLQSQDRGEAPGNKEGTGIMDLIGEGTKDMEVVRALIGKRKVSDVIMGERSGKWL